MNISSVKSIGSYVAQSVKNLPKNVQSVKGGLDGYKSYVLDKNMGNLLDSYNPSSKSMKTACSKIMDKAVKDFPLIKKQIAVGAAAVVAGTAIIGGIIKAVGNKKD